MSDGPGSSAYQRLRRLMADDRCVMLDGGVATELQRLRPISERGPDEALWGTWALYRAPDAVYQVHRRYVDVGCDVISTNTWSILSAPEVERLAGPGQPEAGHWMDVARLGIRLARDAIRDGGREDQCAVAFAISEDATAPACRGTLELLLRVFEEAPPDLLLLETLTLIREPTTFETVEWLLGTGLPVWLSFRRCRHGVCGVYGQHWGPPEGDLFGRAARRFEELGVGALLINCLPASHVPGMLPWLRDFTDLPLGVYPNLGYLRGKLWRFDEKTGPAEYATLAQQWRADGAQIVGGCCGVTPEHLRAAVQALAGAPAGRGPSARPIGGRRDPAAGAAVEKHVLQPWTDACGRALFPLPFPRLSVEDGVFVPTQGSFLLWKHLFQTGLGRGKRCLDVGSGSGILSVQLALNGADHVHAIDVDRNAVACTMANAFRNGVADRVSAADIDLYQWEPDERFDVIVASLYQMPVDPFGEPTGHRPLDYWGRNLLDHFLRLVPRLLADEGAAYLMQLSIIGQRETARLLAEVGLEVEVVDFTFFPFTPLFQRHLAQIRRVEQLSDAYHLSIGGQDVMVAYLCKLRHRREQGEEHTG